MIELGISICPLLSIGKEKLVLCNELCGMLRKYNTGQTTILYCGLCQLVERT